LRRRGEAQSFGMTPNIAELTDHTLLKPETTSVEISQLCEEAKKGKCWSVCVNPYWIPTVKQRLNGSGVRICTVIGYPLGATLSKAKAQEATDAVEAGADEIDMMLNTGAAKEGHWNFIEHEIHDVVSAARGKTVKVILDTRYLNEAEVAEAGKRIVAGGAHFVAAWSGLGDLANVIRLIRKTVGSSFGVKACAVPDHAAAEALLQAGANRLGTSGRIF
jgi:deoxyribose-phosphate aldolase